MSKTNIENLNVTINFLDPEHDVSKKAAIYDPYTPIVLRKGIVSWTTKENLIKQLRSLAVGDKLMLQPVDREGEMDLVKSPMSFVVHEKCLEPEQSLLLISENVLFDHPMHKGGIVSRFEETDLYIYLNTEFKFALPQDIQDLLVGGIRIPTAGMVFGQNDDWCNEHLVMDTHEQLQLMKQRKNRITADKDDDLVWWWLSNKVKDEFSTPYFAAVESFGYAVPLITSSAYGVRPAFWIRCKHVDVHTTW